MAAIDRIEAWSRSDVGRVRPQNEDSVLVEPSLGLYAVADGMGGHQAGEIASRMALDAVLDHLHAGRPTLEGYAQAKSKPAREAVLRLLERAAQAACVAVFEAGRREPKLRGMGTTLCALLVVSSRAFIAHVGDSRAYLIRGPKTHLLTQDHTLENELLRRGKLSPEQIAQVKQKHSLTRAIGIWENVEVDVIDFDLRAGDSVMLCSDGLYNYVKEPELGQLLSRAGEDVCERLVALANERGGRDNISCVLVHASSSTTRATEQPPSVSLEALKEMPLFRFLNTRELVRIINRMEIRTLLPGEPVFKEGDPGEELFVVLAGSVRVHSGGSEIAQLGAGEHFGEMAMIDSAPRSASVTAVETSRLMVIPRTDFFDILRHDRDTAVKMLWCFLGALSRRLRTANKAARDSQDAGDLLDAVFEGDEPV